MSYIVTYIFPFLDAPQNDVAKAASLALMFLVLCILYVNSNLIYTNQLVTDDGQEKLLFENDREKRWLILKLLDDDYLGSVMTRQKYEVNSKSALGP